MKYLTIINAKIIPEKFLRPTNLASAKLFGIHKSFEIIIVGEN